MAEYQDPPLRLSIEGMRWLGDEWGSLGETPASLDLWGTDSGEGATVLRALRVLAARRLQMQLFALTQGCGALDFDAPNAPTERDLAELIVHADAVLISLQALRQMAPEIGDDDDDGEDGEEDPAPDPEPSEARMPASSRTEKP